jgi:ribosomal protein S12 methylthiotransferase accessory factor
MAYSNLRGILPQERFWFPISTGCAAHFDINTALFNAVCELIERDAIAMTWLKQLQLPRIAFDEIPSELRNYGSHYLADSSPIHFEFYDATLDLGVPTVYGLRIASPSARARTLVGCATASDIETAICKVFRDLVSLSTAFRNPRPYPEDISDFRQIMHGAAYMASSERESAFDFLRSNGLRHQLSETRVIYPKVSDLMDLINRLRRDNMKAYALDLTTDEAASVGLHVVRVVIPALQPLSFHHIARFLGHSRLHTNTLPVLSSFPGKFDVNPLPQPFA